MAQPDAAEKKLELDEKKLQTLKGSINRLVSAIFGKSERLLVISVFLTFFAIFLTFLYFLVFLQEKSVIFEGAMKLNCTFAIVKQLFEGASKDIGATQPKPPSMKRVTDLMGPLSVVSEWVKLGKLPS